MVDRLTVVGFATAHVTGLTVLGILALHYSSSLGDLLAPIGTVAGLLLFSVLWAVAIVTHHYGFEAIDPWSVEDRSTAIRYIGAGFAYGALTGAGAFWGFAFIGILNILLSDPARAVEFFAIPTVFIALIGTAFSLGIGGVVGIGAVIFDASVIGAITRFAQQ